MPAENLKPISWERVPDPNKDTKRHRKVGRLAAFAQRLRAITERPLRKSEYPTAPQNNAETSVPAVQGGEYNPQHEAPQNIPANKPETPPKPPTEFPERTLEAVPPVIDSEFAQSLNNKTEQSGGRHRPENDDQVKNYSVDAITNRINAERAAAEQQNANVIGTQAWHEQQLVGQMNHELPQYEQRQNDEAFANRAEVIGSDAWHQQQASTDAEHRFRTTDDVIGENEFPVFRGNLRSINHRPPEQNHDDNEHPPMQNAA